MAIACAWILAAVLIPFVVLGIVAPHVVGAEFAYRLQQDVDGMADALAGSACVVVWYITGRRWPLGLTALFVAQIVVHRAQAGAVDNDSHRLLAWASLDLLNLCQLAWTNVGPDARDTIRVLRRLLARRTDRVRRAVASAIEQYVARDGERTLREKSRW